MRENKFRAWHKKLKEWYFFPVIYSEGCACDLEDIDEETLGQYTGLKDKNGVEIYEGDIVKYLQAEYNEDTLLYEDRITVCEWYEDAYALILKFEEGRLITPFPMAITKKLEVIGNIYENPELLT